MGTYFELLVYDRVVEFYNLEQKLSDQNEIIEKLQLGIDLYTTFFKNNEYHKNYTQEKANIEVGARRTLKKIANLIGKECVINVRSSSQDFRE